MTLEKIFNPQSIAIVGASEETGKVGNVIAKNILELGYKGEVFLVNPKHDEIFGKKCYKSLSEIEKSVDVAIMAIPAKFVNDEVKNSVDKVKNFVIVSAGFSEVGEEGKKREEELLQIAEKNNLNILGPNCLGFIIPRLNLNASFAGGMSESGNIAFISQSGALAVAMMDVAKKENIKFSSIISIGNKIQIGETEALEYFLKDPETKVIGMYLEGIKDGLKFIKVSSRATKEKPIVIIKAGKTERAQKAISSHTGALAGSEKITKAVFDKTGVIEAQNLEEFFDLVELVSSVNAPVTNKVVVITNAGGPGVLTTDAFSGKNIELADIEEKTRGKLSKILPVESALSNPIDLLGDAKEDRYSGVLKIVEKDANIGTVICVLTPQDQTPVDKIAKKIINFRRKTKKTVVTVFIGGDRVKKAVRKLEENGIPNFVFPDRAVKALDSYYTWNVKKNDIPVEVEENINSERKEKAEKIIEKAKSEGRNALYFSEAGDMMKQYGINCIESVNIPGSKNSVGLLEPYAGPYPVVLKVDSDKVLHKTDKKGLILDIKNQKELEKSILEMKDNFPGERLIIQPMMPRDTEIILGIKKDPIFGPVIVYGLGGIYTEVFKMVDFLISPASEEEIIESLKRSKIKFLFQETRGQKAYNISEFAQIAFGLVSLSKEVGNISEFDINPLLIYNDNKPAVAVDVKIII